MPFSRSQGQEGPKGKQAGRLSTQPPVEMASPCPGNRLAHLTQVEGELDMPPKWPWAEYPICHGLCVSVEGRKKTWRTERKLLLLEPILEWDGSQSLPYWEKARLVGACSPLGGCSATVAAAERNQAAEVEVLLPGQPGAWLADLAVSWEEGRPERALLSYSRPVQGKCAPPPPSSCS